MSALSPAPVPRDGNEERPGTALGQRAAISGRPNLAIAPDPRAAADGDDDVVPPVQAAPRVQLVPRTEPAARVLPAEGPAHVRPPVAGSPTALARPRPLVGVAEPETESAGEPLPDPTRLCCAVVQAAVEGLRGVRPLAQLVRWVTPEVYERLALRAHLVQHSAVPPASGRAGIRRVRVFRIGDCAAEATVVVDDGPRVRAVALRVEEHRGRWRATVLEIG